MQRSIITLRSSLEAAEFGIEATLPIVVGSEPGRGVQQFELLAEILRETIQSGKECCAIDVHKIKRLEHLLPFGGREEDANHPPGVLGWVVPYHSLEIVFE